MENLESEYSKMHREADVYTELSADYSLPDYNGDIKKVLYTSATVLPSARFNDSESVSGSGVVSYDVIYVNGEGEVDRLNFTSDYEVNSRIKSDSVEYADLQTRVGSFSHRLFGPRRLNMKATLISEVRLIESEVLETGADIAENADAECVVKNIKVGNTKILHSREREYAECITKLEGVIEGEVELIYSTANASVESVKAEEGGASVKGVFVVSAIIRSDGTTPTTYKKRIPFDEFIEGEGITADMQAMATVAISSVSASTVSDDEGVSVNVSLIAECSVIASGNRDIRFVKDGFLRGAECECKYEKINYTTHLGYESKTASVLHTLPISDLCDTGIRGITFMNAQARVTEFELSDSHVGVNVEIKLQGICESVDNEGRINHFAIKTSCNSSEKVNINGQNCDNLICECNARVVDTVANVDEENLYIEVSYALNCEFTEAKSEQRLAALEEKENGKLPPRGSKITVYYPTEDDSLFSVARSYRTSVRDIAAANMLSESVMNCFDEPGSLVGVERLIIK